jgi:hypothetical protein
MAPVSIPIRLYYIFHYASYSFRVTSSCCSSVMFVEKRSDCFRNVLFLNCYHAERERELPDGREYAFQFQILLSQHLGWMRPNDRLYPRCFEVIKLTAKSEAGSNYPFIGVRSLNSQYSAGKLQDRLLQRIDFPGSTFASPNQDVINHARYCY